MYSFVEDNLPPVSGCEHKLEQPVPSFRNLWLMFSTKVKCVKCNEEFKLVFGNWTCSVYDKYGRMLH